MIYTDTDNTSGWGKHSVVFAAKQRSPISSNIDKTFLNNHDNSSTLSSNLIARNNKQPSISTLISIPSFYLSYRFYDSDDHIHGCKHGDQHLDHFPFSVSINPECFPRFSVTFLSPAAGKISPHRNRPGQIKKATMGCSVEGQLNTQCLVSQVHTASSHPCTWFIFTVSDTRQ